MDLFLHPAILWRPPLADVCFVVIYFARSFTGHTGLDQHGKRDQHHPRCQKAYESDFVGLVILHLRSAPGGSCQIPAFPPDSRLLPASFRFGLLPDSFPSASCLFSSFAFLPPSHLIPDCFLPLSGLASSFQFCLPASFPPDSRLLSDSICYTTLKPRATDQDRRRGTDDRQHDPYPGC